MIVEFINGIEFGFQHCHDLYSVGKGNEILEKCSDLQIFKFNFPSFEIIK